MHVYFTSVMNADCCYKGICLKGAFTKSTLGGALTLYKISDDPLNKKNNIFF